MTILCDRDICDLVDKGLVTSPDGLAVKINPASIDIRIGPPPWKVEYRTGMKEEHAFERFCFSPGTFALIPTFESFHVPNGYALDLRLKSSSARTGWDHSLAFWVDPGWNGVLTMEVRNTLKFTDLMLEPGQYFAQVIVHRLSGESLRPYVGKYNNAVGVEGAKEE